MTVARSMFRAWLLALLFTWNPGELAAQNAVNVTIEAEDTTLAPGESTTVTVYAQIDTAIEETSDQIFSWYIDLLNDNGAVAQGYTNLLTPSSDNTPPTSGDGTLQGSNLRGIFDTFLNLQGAGKGSRVVLVQFDVVAVAAGTANFTVAPGTTIDLLSTDFRVSQTGDGSYTGGVYSGASLSITVSGQSAPELLVSVIGNQAQISFDPVPGFDHVVQYSDGLTSPGSWTDLAGGPHNSGVVTQDILGVPRRFYRLVLTPE